MAALVVGASPKSTHQSSEKASQGKQADKDRGGPTCATASVTIQTHCVCPPAEVQDANPDKTYLFTKACVEWAGKQRELKAFETNEQACAQGNQEACFRAGRTLLYGIPGWLDPNAEQGLALMEQACRQAPRRSSEKYGGYDQIDICSFVAEVYKSGIENTDGTERIRQNKSKAIEIYQLMCNEQWQDAGACTNLARWYRRDPELAGEAKRARLYEARACLAEVAEQEEFDQCVAEKGSCSRGVFDACKDLVVGGPQS